MAFSLAASAVSLARSVAVSAKVLDGVSPAQTTRHSYFKPEIESVSDLEVLKRKRLNLLLSAVAFSSSENKN